MVSGVLKSLRLLDLKTGHQPVKLLSGKLTNVLIGAWPAESSLYFDTFVQKNKTIRFPQQGFHSIASLSAKKV